VYVVPAGVSQIQVLAIGAPGGDGLPTDGLVHGGSGGFGARLVVVLPVTAGQRLYVEVGAAGTTGGTGGANGGGNASDGGGSGGGATDLRTCSVMEASCADGSASTLASRLLVAAGGGGGGGGTPGGNGGYAAMAGQTMTAGSSVDTGGGAGIGGGGGLGGTSSSAGYGAPGDFGVGGAGGHGLSILGGIAGGGGGGAGYFGGGGGGGGEAGGAGGGGGSSYVSPTATSLFVGFGGTPLVMITPVVSDVTAPQIAATLTPAAADGTNGWYRSDVSVSWSVNDPDSAVTAQSGCDPASVTADTIGQDFTCLATSAGGTASTTVSVKRDATPPTVALSGGPADGGTYPDGSVPAVGACSATDATSQVATCTVTGYDTAVGTHTVTATATDFAGNSATATATYTVTSAWTMQGFFAPVHPDAVNLVKGGSTVPLKFTVSNGTAAVTDPATITVATRQVACPGASMESVAVTTNATGDTTLRYDVTSGQFIYNWRVPNTSNTCYQVSMSAGGTSLDAVFQVR
jgi:hypothetical protein